jgi:hypothetical protein
MFGVKNTFSKPKNKLYYIEIDDDKIDIKLSKIISQTQKKINEFKSHINENTLTIKEEWLSEIHKLMLEIRTDVKQLQIDVDRIINIELENKDFLIIKDDDYLVDKKTQLEKVYLEIEEFIIIVDQKPSAQALQSELLEQLIKQIININLCIQQIINDDHQLQNIYEKLNEI